MLKRPFSNSSKQSESVKSASLYSIFQNHKSQETKKLKDLTTSWNNNIEPQKNISYPSYPPISSSISLASSYTSHNKHQRPQSKQLNAQSKNNIDISHENFVKSTDNEVLSNGISLSEAQHRVLQIILQRKSVFFTGAAGTGKSFILKVLSEVLGELNLTDSFALTAPTGVAACNIRGLTIHSWSGVGIVNTSDVKSKEKAIASASKNPESKKRWLRTNILIIDEISMLSAELFDLISNIGKQVRGNNNPFGNIQIILCGDFFQLPPVGLGSNTHFCFESEDWKELFSGKDGVVVLDKVFRQKDSTFLTMLNEIRRGYISSSTDKILIQKARDYSHLSQDSISGVKPTKLFPINREVDAYNLKELEKLDKGSDDSLVEVYNSVDDDQGKPNSKHSSQLKSLKAPSELELRVGSQVMLLKNLNTSRGLVNGARGRVVSFESYESFEFSKPNILSNKRFPKVEFEVNLGGEKVIDSIVLVGESFDIQEGSVIKASRNQIPLMLAWAISIHKAQGMTIPYLDVSLHGVFEYGQAYVALSRATDLEGLKLRGYTSNSIKTHQQVVDWYKKMGYSSDSVHCDSKTHHTTIAELSKLYQKEKVNTRSRHEDEDGWMSSKHEIKSVVNKVKKIIGGASIGTHDRVEVQYDDWLDGQINGNNNTNNNFSKFEYNSNQNQSYSKSNNHQSFNLSLTPEENSPQNEDEDFNYCPDNTTDLLNVTNNIDQNKEIYSIDNYKSSNDVIDIIDDDDDDDSLLIINNNACMEKENNSNKITISHNTYSKIKTTSSDSPSSKIALSIETKKKIELSRLKALKIREEKKKQREMEISSYNI